MKVICQNPDTAHTLAVVLDAGAVVHDLANRLVHELRLNLPPVIYAYLESESARDLSRRTAVDGERVILPDDLPVSYVLEHLRDPGLPIYFQTPEITVDKLFELRTLRFRQLGHNVSRLQSSKVLIGGAGLLGGEIAANLATLGVGTFHIVDNGYVDWLNLYRQSLFTKQNVYTRKVEVVKSRLEEMGGVSVNAVSIEVPCWTSSSLTEVQLDQSIGLLDQLITDTDVVVGAFDKFSPRALLQFICLVRKRPFVVAALEPGQGEITMFDKAEHGCYCCGLPDPREGKWYDGGACTLATLESQRIVSAIATRLIVDRLEGKESPVNQVVYDVNSMAIMAHRRSGSSRCSLCGESGVTKSPFVNLVQAIKDWLFSE